MKVREPSKTSLDAKFRFGDNLWQAERAVINRTDLTKNNIIRDCLVRPGEMWEPVLLSMSLIPGSVPNNVLSFINYCHDQSIGESISLGDLEFDY